MEGFRYVKNDSNLFPVYREGKLLTDFPTIPIGMLDIWREQNGDDDFGALLGQQ